MFIFIFISTYGIHDCISNVRTLTALPCGGSCGTAAPWHTFSRRRWESTHEWRFRRSGHQFLHRITLAFSHHTPMSTWYQGLYHDSPANIMFIFIFNFMFIFHFLSGGSLRLLLCTSNLHHQQPLPSAVGSYCAPRNGREPPRCTLSYRNIVSVAYPACYLNYPEITYKFDVTLQGCTATSSFRVLCAAPPRNGAAENIAVNTIFLGGNGVDSHGDWRLST